MTLTHKDLHDSYISNKMRGRSTSYVASRLLLVSLIFLGVLLAITLLKRPPAINDHKTPPGGDFSTDQCRAPSGPRHTKEQISVLLRQLLSCPAPLVYGPSPGTSSTVLRQLGSMPPPLDGFTSQSLGLVESIPQHMKYKANVTLGIPLEKVWKDLLSMATDQVNVVSFYWTLTGEDINVNSSSDIVGKELLKELEELPSRNVSLQLVTSFPTIKSKSTDLEILEQKGAQVRKVNFGRLTGGVLHSKFWIVDGRHVFIGSANMDWRALTQVKELGVVVYNCSGLAKDLLKIFKSYWVMGLSNSTVPQPWPVEYDTDINKFDPLLVKTDNISSRMYLTASPASFCPTSRTQDLEDILSIISEAHQFVHVAVMEYFPSTRFEKPRRYWPQIDDAIRTAAFDRNVKIRMLISCGQDSDPGMLPFLQSLASIDSPEEGVSIQIKLFIVPVGNQSNIPFSRVNHNKYMVTDQVAYIGTSNWSGDYFLKTGGVGLVISQRAPYPVWKTKALQSQLGAVFERDWQSEFAVNLAELDHHPDCSLSN